MLIRIKFVEFSKHILLLDPPLQVRLSPMHAQSFTLWKLKSIIRQTALHVSSHQQEKENIQFNMSVLLKI